MICSARVGAYDCHGRGAVMGDPKSGVKRRRAIGTRDRVMARLAAGEITDDAGMASTVLAAVVGYHGSSIAFAQLLSGMERSGLIERAVRGKRTYRIAIAAGAPGVRPATGPAGAPGGFGRARPPAAALGGTETGRHLAAAAGGGFDYDELARRLLFQVVRQLAAESGAASPAPLLHPAHWARRPRRTVQRPRRTAHRRSGRSPAWNRNWPASGRCTATFPQRTPSSANSSGRPGRVSTAPRIPPQPSHGSPRS